MRQLRITEVKLFAQMAQPMSGRAVVLLRHVCIMNPHSVVLLYCLLGLVKLMVPKLVFFSYILKYIDIIKLLPEIVIQIIWGRAHTWAACTQAHGSVRVTAFHCAWPIIGDTALSFFTILFIPWQHKSVRQALVFLWVDWTGFKLESRCSGTDLSMLLITKLLPLFS